jgi:hypothetical protein
MLSQPAMFWGVIGLWQPINRCMSWSMLSAECPNKYAL